MVSGSNSRLQILKLCFVLLWEDMHHLHDNRFWKCNLSKQYVSLILYFLPVGTLTSENQAPTIVKTDDKLNSKI